MKPHIFITSFLVLTAFACNQIENNNNNGTASGGDTTTIINNPQKTDAEIYAEQAQAAIDLIQKKHAENKRNDSITIAGKKPFWVYQIGSPMDNEEALFDKYRVLQSIGNIYAFKISRNNFIMVLDQGKTEAEARESLSEIRSKVGSIDNRVDVINLTAFCSKKENPVKTDNLKRRRQDIEVPCYICN